MIGEVDILGVFIPALLWMMLIAYAINLVIRKALSYTRFYEYVWHRSIFDLGLYVIVLGIIVSLTHR
jgi:vacuolar-type H+-ATPase subunit I/STV1